MAGPPNLLFEAFLNPPIHPPNMKTTHQKPSIFLRPFLFCLFISLLLLLLLSLQPQHRPKPPSPPHSYSYASDLRMRRGPAFSSYEDYLKHQLNKTLNPMLRRIWTTRDWDRKVVVFSRFFQQLQLKNLLSNASKALCIGARVGQEVFALKLLGVNDSIGIDLVPRPPLVLRGDFHAQPFKNETFDFEFSNVFDHALYPRVFVSEIERTLKPGGVCALHVAVTRWGDKYSANDLYSVTPLVDLFRESEVVYMGRVDGFGLDTEIVFQKKRRPRKRFLP